MALIDIDQTIDELTLDEKASLLSGADFWHSTSIKNIPSVMLTDGPHGLRKQAGSADHLGLGDSVPATCFPTAAALGSSWDIDLVHRVGVALGTEAAANDVAVLLGPGVNIKRSPLCGRNFEYVSEDPVISGDIGRALIDGIQSRGVGTSIKHFAANNQETDRMRSSSEVDERTLREIYLTAFERALAAKPTTIMCSYNKINGIYASEDPWLLTTVLRDEWGFDGAVISDWGAVRDPVASLRAGLDLEMPSTHGRSAARIVAAVRSGDLDESTVDEAVRRWLGVLNRTPGGTDTSFDAASHHALAREAAAAGCVLLRNETIDGTPILPLTGRDGVVVIGEFARTPRYQGAGSSQVRPTQLDDALTALRTALKTDLPFAPGFLLDGDDPTLADEAVNLARTASTVILFLGLPSIIESEGYDRDSMDLPTTQRALLARLTEVCERVVVVLANGGALALPWRHDVAAIIEGWLGGQAGGSGIADILTGAVNPSGRLTETLPERIQDTPSYGNYPGEFGVARYGEGLQVGYRWYDARDLDVAYPFGFGLSYTTFHYDRLTVDVTGMQVRVTVEVTNTGDRAGADVVQVYVGDVNSSVWRPVRELKAFSKVHLEPGQSQTVDITLTARDLSFWHPALRRWVVEGGEFTVSIGASSRDIRAQAVINVVGEDIVMPLSDDSTIREVLAHPVAGAMLQHALASVPQLDPASLAMLQDAPLRALVDFGITPLTPQLADEILAC